MSKLLSSKKHRSSARAQAIVEFAIALPILMFMLVGILEVGRLIFGYAAVINASREAARYASAVGYADNTTYKKFQYCEGIREAARRSAFLMNLSDSDIVITYDHGSLGTTFDTCDGTVDTGVNINTGANFDRATVTINTTYTPMVNLVPIPARPLVSSSSRTILGIYELPSVAGGSGGGGGGSGGSGGSGGGGGGPTATFTATATATGTPTDTPTSTPTNTPGVVVTLPPLNTATWTPTNTATPTSTSTPTATFTATPKPACDGILLDTISFSKDSPVISMLITNPHTSFTVTSVELKWDANGTKALTSADLGGQFWNGPANSSGNITITPTSTLTLSGYGAQSTIRFILSENYTNAANKTTITLHLSSPACGNITVTKKN